MWVYSACKKHGNPHVICTSSRVPSWGLPYLTQLYTCNSDENLGCPLTHLLFLKCLHLPVTLSAPQYVMTTMIDEGQRKEPGNLYSTYLSSQPLPVLPETLIWSVPNYWHSAEQATRSLQAWAAWVPSLEVQKMHPTLQGLRALSRSGSEMTQMKNNGSSLSLSYLLLIGVFILSHLQEFTKLLRLRTGRKCYQGQMKEL